ncbi:cysteine peptidase family C39 domain-containing protein [Lachnospira multipara]|uniref:cysteine peptidase family C39 domain-containing protein n=1 Tax=Lachnospira multipara TaxID=28051 RepID=UPI002E8E3A26|nr:cysteine peptidase family C39 domain-containing protein [Lachnospira multipara]
MKYYCIKQHDITDCGVACFATVCKQNGYKIGITQIREVAGTDKQGNKRIWCNKSSRTIRF